jgi:type II secretory pathway component PulC
VRFSQRVSKRSYLIAIALILCLCGLYAALSRTSNSSNVLRGINRTSATTWEVKHESIEAYVANPLGLFASTGSMKPAWDGDHVIGLQIVETGANVNALFDALGLETDDILQTINEIEFTEHHNAMSAVYAQSRTPGYVMVVQLQRRGLHLTHTYTVK